MTVNRKRLADPKTPRASETFRWQAELQRASALHGQGRWQEAAPVYVAILAVHPKQFDATHLLGVAFLQAGQLDRAAEQLGWAVALRPEAAGPHVNLGNALQYASSSHGL